MELHPEDASRSIPQDWIDSSGKALFLLGETHGVAATNPLDLALLQYFYRTAGVRYYLTENSYAHSAYLNQYLQTGDERILDFLFTQMRGFVDCSREKRQFWVNLRRWDKSLPAGQRIRILGVDLERMAGISVAFIRQAIGDRPVPGACLPACRHFIAAATSDTFKGLREAVAELAAAQSAHPTDFDEFLQGRSGEVALALNSLDERFSCAADRVHYDQRRDQYLVQNFVALTASERNPRVYGRMGSAHILQRPTDEIGHFSARLQMGSSRWAHAVLGIWPLYAQTRRLDYTGGSYRQVDCSDENLVLGPFLAVGESDQRLYRLVGPSSPFSRSLLIPLPSNGGVTTDYFQYVVLVSQGRAGTPLIPGN